MQPQYGSHVHTPSSSQATPPHLVGNNSNRTRLNWTYSHTPRDSPLTFKPELSTSVALSGTESQTLPTHSRPLKWTTSASKTPAKPSGKDLPLPAPSGNFSHQGPSSSKHQSPKRAPQIHHPSEAKWSSSAIAGATTPITGMRTPLRGAFSLALRSQTSISNSVSLGRTGRYHTQPTNTRCPYMHM